MRDDLGAPDILLADAIHKDDSAFKPGSKETSSVVAHGAIVASRSLALGTGGVDGTGGLDHCGSLDVQTRLMAEHALGCSGTGSTLGLGQGSGTACTYLNKAPAVSDLQKLAVVAGPDSLPFWSAHYLEAVAVGGSPHTLDAKSRDLRAFIAWFMQTTGTLQVRAWRVRDTKSYMASLVRARRAPTTVNRAFATLRHFARWCQDNHALFGTMGLPTHGVEERAVDEAPCKKLDRHEVRALFKAAEDRVTLLDAKRARSAEVQGPDPTRRARPRRDQAMLAVLYFTGLRASELVVLRRDQYTGTHMLDVARKGAGTTRRLYVPKEARRALDDYLARERMRDADAGNGEPLFLAAGSGAYLMRNDLQKALKRIADEANKHRDGAPPIHLHPHRLRHTFGALHREASTSDSETAAALGHKSTKYVGRYARKTDAEREALIEATFEM